MTNTTETQKGLTREYRAIESASALDRDGLAQLRVGDSVGIVLTGRDFVQSWTGPYTVECKDLTSGMMCVRDVDGSLELLELASDEVVRWD